MSVCPPPARARGRLGIMARARLSLFFSRLLFLVPAGLAHGSILNGPYVLLEAADRISIRVEVSQVDYRYRLLFEDRQALEVLPEYRRSVRDTFLAMGVVQLGRQGRLTGYEIWRENELVGRYSWQSRVDGTPLSAPTLLIFGDSQGGKDVLSQHAGRWAKEDHDVLVGLGDLVDTGSRYESWSEEVFAPLDGLLPHRPILVVCGNHEPYRDQRLYWYDWYFGRSDDRRYFLIEFPDLRLIGINNSDLHTKYGYDPVEPLSPQYSFLLGELLQRDRKWKRTFVLSHVPMFSGSTVVNREYGSELQRRYLRPLMEQGRVSAFLAGHHHKYERVTQSGIWGNTLYVVTGGGGGGLFSKPELREGYPMDLQLYGEYHYLHYRPKGEGDGIFLVKSIDGTLLDRAVPGEVAAPAAGDRILAFWEAEFREKFVPVATRRVGRTLHLTTDTTGVAEQAKIVPGAQLLRAAGQFAFVLDDLTTIASPDGSVSLQGYQRDRRSWGYLQGAALSLGLRSSLPPAVVISVNGAELAPLDRLYPVYHWPVAGRRSGVEDANGAIALLRGRTNYDIEPDPDRIIVSWRWGSAVPDDVAPAQVERQLGPVLRDSRVPVDTGFLPEAIFDRLRTRSPARVYLVRDERDAQVATLVHWSSFGILAVIPGQTSVDDHGAMFFETGPSSHLEIVQSRTSPELAIDDLYFIRLP